MITYKRYFNREFFNPPDSKEAGLKGLEGYEHAWFGSVRSTLPELFRMMKIEKGDIVLLPAIAPHGIVLPCRKNRLKILFYHLDNSFNPDTEHIRLLLKETNTKALFLIHFFGINRDFADIAQLAKETGAVVFEDCAHTLFDDFRDIPSGKTGDIALFSLNKILPVPDGALFISNSKDISLKEIATARSLYNTIAVRAGHLHLLLRTFTAYHQRSVPLRKLLTIAAKLCYALYYFALCRTRRPSALSARTELLLKKLNIPKIIKLRMANAETIAGVLPGGKEEILNNGQILSGIPVTGADAQSQKRRLAEHKIYTMTCNRRWWFVAPSLREEFKNEYRLLNNHLLIPVNENIGSVQLRYLADKVNKIVGNADTD